MYVCQHVRGQRGQRAGEGVLDLHLRLLHIASVLCTLGFEKRADALEREHPYVFMCYPFTIHWLKFRLKFRLRGSCLLGAERP